MAEIYIGLSSVLRPRQHSTGYISSISTRTML